MSLAALAAAGPTNARKGPGCTVGTLLRSLPADERAALATMLADEGWLSESIAKVVTSEVGVTMRGQTVARHRRAACSCGDVTV